MDLDTPASSPLWWTLSDEVTPGDLRAQFRDEDAHLERYRAALAAGVPTQDLSVEAQGYLSFYYNLRHTPELTPTWLAFNAFASGHLAMAGEARVVDQLTDRGFGPAEIDTIILFADRQEQETAALVQEIAEPSREFVEIQRRAIQARGDDRRAHSRVKRAAKEGELDLLLPHSKVGRTRLADLRAAWLRLPVSETAERLLPELRERLGEESWERFRRFLLEHVVANMGNEVKDFDLGKGANP